MSEAKKESNKYFNIRKEEDDYLEFELSNVNISLANAIRRVVLTDVKTLAIDESTIKITENTCPLHNEYIAHRLSLIPVIQGLTNLKDLEFYVAKKGTKDVPIENEQVNIQEVTTNDIQVFNKETKTFVDPMEVFDGLFLITKLNLKQKFLCSFEIKEGTARQHSRWQCVNTIAYRYKVKAEKTIKRKYDEVTLAEEKEWITKENNDEPAAFIFYLEPMGKMNPKTIISKSLDIIKDKCDTFIDTVSKPNMVEWNQNTKMIELKYEGEMHTLGNLISTICLDKLGENEFIGYRIEHPMINSFILRMKLDNGDKDTHITRLKKMVEEISNQISDLSEEWKNL